MPRPTPEEPDRAIPTGFSLPCSLADQFDALAEGVAYPGMKQRRSLLLRDLLALSLPLRFGNGWREIANRIIEERKLSESIR